MTTDLYYADGNFVDFVGRVFMLTLYLIVVLLIVVTTMAAVFGALYLVAMCTHRAMTRIIDLYDEFHG